MSDPEACIILNMIPGIGYARYAALVRRFGSPAAVLNASVLELAEVKGIGQALAEAIWRWRETVDLETELNTAARSGASIITIEDGNYPEVLRQLHDPPLVLYVRGTLPDFSCNSLSIIGSRRMSSYGNRMARKFASDAVLAGWKVVSGLAFGVDAAAHEATLDANGVTVGVLGGGLLRIHPQEHVPLAARIVRSGGALISEYPMNFPVSRQTFPRRNRIVAALCQAAVVIEAGMDSGALITAHLALEQGKAVFAVPGRADEPQAAGCNALIRDGEAKLVTSFQDVAADFDFLPGFRLSEAAVEDTNYLAGGGNDGEVSLFNEPERVIYQTLQTQGPANLEELVTRTQLATGLLSGTLLALEIRDIIRKTPAGCYELS